MVFVVIGRKGPNSLSCRVETASEALDRIEELQTAGYNVFEVVDRDGNIMPPLTLYSIALTGKPLVRNVAD